MVVVVIGFDSFLSLSTLLYSLLFIYLRFIYLFPQMLYFRKKNPNNSHSEEVLFWIKNELSFLNPLEEF